MLNEVLSSLERKKKHLTLGSDYQNTQEMQICNNLIKTVFFLIYIFHRVHYYTFIMHITRNYITNIITYKELFISNFAPRVLMFLLF